MAARGVAEMTSKISKRGRGGRSQLVAGKVTGGEELLRWLIGDRGALVEALRRENAWGVNEV
jgi:hypothetical protein